MKRLRTHIIPDAKVGLAAALVAGVWCFSGSARAVEISGRVSSDLVSYGERISSLNSNNASLKLFATVVPTTSIDAAIVMNLERRTYFSDTGLQNYRYRYLYLRYRRAGMEMFLGRQYIPEATGTNLDGIRMMFKMKSKMRIGFYAGTKADPYKRGFQQDYSIYGLFGAIRKRMFDASAAFTTELYNGKLNRGYAVLQSSFRYKTLLRFYESMTVDTDRNLKPLFLTYLNLGAYVTPHRRFRFSLGYSRYQAYQEFALPEVAYFTSFYPTHRYSVRGSAVLSRHFSIEGSRSWSIRTYNDTRTNYYSVSLNARGWYVKGLNLYVKRSRSWGDYYYNVTSTLGGSYLIARRYRVTSSIAHQWNQTQFAAAEASGYIVNNSISVNLMGRYSLRVTHYYSNSAGPAQNGLYSHVAYRF